VKVSILLILFPSEINFKELQFKDCFCCYFITPLYLQDKYGAPFIGPFLISEGKGHVYDRDYTYTLIDFLQWIKFSTGKLKSSLSEGTWIYSDRARAKTTKRQIETNERS
jgi:hypothetical protein